MSEQHHPDTTDETPLEPDLEPGAETGGEQPDEDTKGGKEAAKYRRRLRETEAERDTLAGQLDAARRSIIDTLAGQHLTKPGALWATGTDTTALLDDQGNVDPVLVAEACALARDELGAERPGYAVDDAQGQRGGTPTRGNTFTDAFRPARG